jgi:hypothetical protein
LDTRRVFYTSEGGTAPAGFFRPLAWNLAIASVSSIRKAVT